MWTAECQQEGVATLLGIVCIVRNLLKPLPSLIALAALGMIIFAGFKYISAGADPKAVSSAQQTATYAIIGVLMLSGAWLLILLIERLTGAPVTQFGTPLN